jgi:glucose/arabinose dehydrogenase
VSRRLAATLGVACLLAAVAGCTRPDPLGGFAAPRTVHLAPDGRLLVADQGTGNGDGRVVAVDLASGRRRVLLDRLPSVRGSGQQHADLAGPSAAAMAVDGTVCAVIADATRPRAGFSTLRCSDGLVADLEVYAQTATDGRERASNPYDVAWDGGDGWYVSDAAANAVLHVDRSGRIRTVALLATMAPFGGRPTQGVPTGLARAADGTLYVALFGGAPAGGGPAAVVALRPDLDGSGHTRPAAAARATAPIGVAPTPQGLAVLDYGGSPGDRDRGRLLLIAGPSDPGRVLAAALDRPVGIARLPDGRYLVAETDRGRLRMVTPDPGG